ncbi:hypothetical protein [Halomonas sp. AOP42-A1-14]
MHELATKEDLRQMEMRLTVTMAAASVGIQSLVMVLLKLFD